MFIVGIIFSIHVFPRTFLEINVNYFIFEAVIVYILTTVEHTLKVLFLFLSRFLLVLNTRKIKRRKINEKPHNSRKCVTIAMKIFFFRQSKIVYNSNIYA